MIEPQQASVLKAVTSPLSPCRKARLLAPVCWKLRTADGPRKVKSVIETAERYPHLIFRAEDGFPVIERAGFKAIHLIANHVAHGWSAEELVVNSPQLTLGEVYSVLAWFADHRDAVTAVLEKSAAGARALSLEARHQQLAVRLRESGGAGA